MGGCGQALKSNARALKNKRDLGWTSKAAALTEFSEGNRKYKSPSPPYPPGIYFVQEGEDGPIKIGMAADPAGRLGSMQTGNPRMLYVRRVLAHGGRIDEERFHQMFAAYRIRGEWFHPVPELLEFMGSDEVPEWFGKPPPLRLDLQPHAELRCTRCGAPDRPPEEDLCSACVDADRYYGRCA